MKEDEYEEETKHLCNAMIQAQKAFEDYFTEKGYDAAYWSLYLTGYVLSSAFEKLKEVKMSLNATGLEEFEYPDKKLEADDEG